MQSHLLLWPFANFLRPLTSSPALDNGLKIRRGGDTIEFQYDLSSKVFDEWIVKIEQA
jgi:hypothetical protein